MINAEYIITLSVNDFITDLILLKASAKKTNTIVQIHNYEKLTHVLPTP